MTTLTTGLTIPWDLAVLPDGSVLFTERGGGTKLRRTNGSVQTVATNQSDLFVGSESGLMGLTLDPSFATNRTYYTCQAYQGAGTPRSTSACCAGSSLPTAPRRPAAAPLC